MIGVGFDRAGAVFAQVRPSAASLLDLPEDLPQSSLNAIAVFDDIFEEVFENWIEKVGEMCLRTKLKFNWIEMICS